jgi:hypothetical protein
MSTELANSATGHMYVIRQSKNRDLIRESLEQLRELRLTAKTRSIVKLIDGFIHEGEEKYGFRAYDVAETLENPYQSLSTDALPTLLLFFVGLLTISMYISAINASLRSAEVGKN